MSGNCDDAHAITQRIRCYNLADLQLLLEGAGLALEHGEVDGMPLGIPAAGHTAQSGLWNAWSYRVLLVAAPSR